MTKKTDTVEAEIVEEGTIILKPFKDIDLTEGVDLDELMKTYAEVPEIDPEAENAGEQYQYVLKGHKAFVKARNKIEKVRKALKAPALEFGKIVDTKAKELAKKIAEKEVALFVQRQKVEKNEERKIQEHERAERERLLNINNLIERIKNLPMSAIGKTSLEIQDIIRTAPQPTQENCEERLGEAVTIWRATSEALDSMYESAVRVEKADEIQAEDDAKRAKLRAKLDAEHQAEREAFKKEKAEFEAEKRALAEEQSLREAEEREAKMIAEEQAEVDRVMAKTKEVQIGIVNDIHRLYEDGGIGMVAEAILDNKINNLRWSV